MSIDAPMEPTEQMITNPVPEADWRQNISAFMDEHIPPGMPAEVFVYGLLGAGAVGSMITRNPRPMITVVQGLAGTTAANMISATVDHKQAAHGSAILSPWTSKILRTFASLSTGLHTYISAPAHIEHHENIGNPENPHMRQPGNRLDMWRHLKSYIDRFAASKPDKVAAHQNQYMEKTPLDSAAFTIGGVATTHLLLGVLLGQSVSSSSISAAIQGAGEHIFFKTFTADSHRDDDEPINVGLTPLTSIVMGGENNHKDHHERPWDPRHAKWDPSYGLIWLLEKAGLATVPARETEFYLEKHPK